MRTTRARTTSKSCHMTLGSITDWQVGAIAWTVFGLGIFYLSSRFLVSSLELSYLPEHSQNALVLFWFVACMLMTNRLSRVFKAFRAWAYTVEMTDDDFLYFGLGVFGLFGLLLVCSVTTWGRRVPFLGDLNFLSLPNVAWKFIWYVLLLVATLVALFAAHLPMIASVQFLLG